MDSPQYSSIFRDVFDVNSSDGFKPYYKWIVLNTVKELRIQKRF